MPTSRLPTENETDKLFYTVILLDHVFYRLLLYL